MFAFFFQIYLIVSNYSPVIMNETRLIGIEETKHQPIPESNPENLIRKTSNITNIQRDDFINTMSPVSHKQMTSSTRSNFHVMNGNDVTAGGIVEVLLEAVDTDGIPQTSGGDFWFALLHTPSFNYSTSGAILDNGNGSYKIFFYAAISGTFNVNITLVHPHEALVWLREVYVPDEDTFTWDGQFISNGLKLTQQCQVRHIPDDYQFDKDQFCFYGYGTDGLGHAAFVCGHPPNGTDCNTLEYLTAHEEEKALDAPVDKLLKGKEYLFTE